MEIHLQPLGEVGQNILVYLQGNLCEIFGCPVSISDPIPIPEEAFSRKRKQYLSDKFLDKLKRHNNLVVTILGITEVNLYTEGLNFVFGQADLERRVAVISLNLLRQEKYGLPMDNDLLAERALKEAVHEIGHTLGIQHCSNGICVMHFSNSLIDTDCKKCHFCGRCRPKLPI
jgi:archaemetzincin